MRLPLEKFTQPGHIIYHTLSLQESEILSLLIQDAGLTLQTKMHRLIKLCEIKAYHPYQTSSKAYPQ